MKLEWEDVTDDLAGWMRRAKVSGGWIYRHTDDLPIYTPDAGMQYGHAWTTSMVFVPNEDLDYE